METFIFNFNATDPGTHVRYRGEVYSKLVPDTSQIQLRITLICLEGGATKTWLHPLPPDFGLLHVEKICAVRVEQITF